MTRATPIRQLGLQFHDLGAVDELTVGKHAFDGLLNVHAELLPLGLKINEGNVQISRGAGGWKLRDGRESGIGGGGFLGHGWAPLWHRMVGRSLGIRNFSRIQAFGRHLVRWWPSPVKHTGPGKGQGVSC